MSRIYTLLTILLVITCGAVSAQDNCSLSLNLKAGQRFDYKLTVDAPTTIKVAGISQTAQQKMELTYHYTVLEAQEDRYLLELVLDRYIMDMSHLFKSLRFDTNSDSTDAMTTRLKSEINRPIKIWYNKQFEAIGEPVIEGEGKMDLLSNVMRPVFYTLSPLKLGERYTTTTYPLAGGISSFQGSLMLQAVTENACEIVTEGDASLILGDKVLMSGPMQGVITIDRQTGMLQSNTEHRDVKCKLNFPEGEIEGISEIEFVSKATATLKRL